MVELTADSVQSGAESARRHPEHLGCLGAGHVFLRDEHQQFSVTGFEQSNSIENTARLRDGVEALGDAQQRIDSMIGNSTLTARESLKVSLLERVRAAADGTCRPTCGDGDRGAR